MISNKEVAKEIKKALKENFKGVKFSVTSSIYGIQITYNENDADIQEVKNIIGKYTLETSDTIYINNSIVHYSDTTEYKQQQQKEYEEDQRQLEQQRTENEKIYNDNVKIESININKIKIVNVKDKNIFVNALVPSINKNDWKIKNDKYIDEKHTEAKHKITDIILMNENEYNYLCFNLLNDYSFLNEKGGTEVDEVTEKALYSYGVCVYSEGKEMLIIDPQGYSYARYICRLQEDINGALEKAIEEITEQKPTPEPPKTKKEHNSNKNTKHEEKELKINNVIEVNFKSNDKIINSENDWRQEKATPRQLFSLYLTTKIKTTNLIITKGEASDLISKSKAGKDITNELQQIKNNQSKIAK